MSSTNRGATRQPDDHYVTPPWCTWAVLPALEALWRGFETSYVLEPACGEGAILRVLREAWPRARLAGFELDASRAAKAAEDGFDVTCRDALTPQPWPLVSLAMTNPPFSLALEFAKKGVGQRLVRPNQNTLLLLRLNWLGSAERVAFHRETPAHIFVLGKRPVFGLNKHGKPGTDSCEYGWFGWGPAFTPGRWQMLDLDAVPAPARTWERRGTKGAP